jgi:hypothetical protein
MSRPASPIRIRQPTLNQSPSHGKIRVNFEVSNPPASHPLNLPQTLKYQHGFEGGQSTGPTRNLKSRYATEQSAVIIV